MILDVEKMKPGTYPVSLSAPVGLPADVTVVKIVPQELQVKISDLTEPPAGQ